MLKKYIALLSDKRETNLDFEETLHLRVSESYSSQPFQIHLGPKYSEQHYPFNLSNQKYLTGRYYNFSGLPISYLFPKQNCLNHFEKKLKFKIIYFQREIDQTKLLPVLL